MVLGESPPDNHAARVGFAAQALQPTLQKLLTGVVCEGERLTPHEITRLFQVQPVQLIQNLQQDHEEERQRLEASLQDAQRTAEVARRAEAETTHRMQQLEEQLAMSKQIEVRGKMQGGANGRRKKNQRLPQAMNAVEIAKRDKLEEKLPRQQNQQLEQTSTDECEAAIKQCRTIFSTN